jgi:enterobacterial common antigen flippase
MKRLIKTTLAIGVSEVLLLSVGLVRNKYLAISIGPEGFGIFSLLNSFFLLMSAFAGTWLGTGTTKFIAQYISTNDDDNKNRIFQYSVIIASLLSLFITVQLILNKNICIEHFLNNDINVNYFYIFIAGFIWTNLRQVFLAALQGALATQYVVKSRIYIAVFDITSVVLLVAVFNLAGYFISICLTSVFAVMILAYYTYVKCGFTIIIQKDNIMENSTFKQFLIFGGYNFVTGIVNLSSAYLQRYILIVTSGVNKVGLFQAGISMMTNLSAINRGSLFYLLPAMSGSLADEERVKSLNEYIYFVLITTIPICIIVIPFGENIITLLFSDKFTSLCEVLYLFIIGQIVIIFMSSFQLTVVGMEKLKIHLFSVIVIHGTWVLIPFIFSKQYGIASAAYGIILGGIFGILIYSLYLWRYIHYVMSYENLKLIFLNSISIALFIYFKDDSMLWKGPISVFYMLLLLTCIGKNRLMLMYQQIVKRRNIGA